MEGRYLYVPLSVIDYFNKFYPHWSGELIIDCTEKPVLLVPSELPMDEELNDWMEPYVWWLRKLRTIMEITFSPTPKIRAEYELARLHLVVWTMEAELRKGRYYPERLQAGGGT